jgi:hypothetical protein
VPVCNAAYSENTHPSAGHGAALICCHDDDHEGPHHDPGWHYDWSVTLDQRRPYHREWAATSQAAGGLVTGPAAGGCMSCAE